MPNFEEIARFMLYPDPRVYLGDALYAEYEYKTQRILLCANNGQKIWINPETFESLKKFYNQYFANFL